MRILRSSASQHRWRGRLATFVVAVTAAMAVAVVSPIGGTSMASAADPPSALPEGWQGTVSVTHTNDQGTTSITATFDPTGFRRSQSWADAFPWDSFFVDQAGTSRMWQQDYSVDYSYSGSTPGFGSGDENSSICMPSTTTTRTAPTHRETVHIDQWGQTSDFDQIAIGDLGESFDPRQVLLIDLRGVVADVTQTHTVNGDCPGINPQQTVSQSSVGYRFDLLHGFGGGLATQNAANNVDADWPMVPGPNGEIRLQGSKSFSGLLIGGDETDSSTITWDLTLVPGEPDTDGDGVSDTDDACPLVPGPPSNQGCPGPSSDCSGEADNRGFAVADYRAEINTLLGDPDLFRFEVSGNWCEIDGLIEMDTVDHQGYVELGATLGTALELLGFTFQYDPARSSSIGTESGGTAEVIAIGQFDACFDWLALAGSGAGSRVIKGAVREMAKAISRHIPTGRLGSVDAIVQNAVAEIDARIIALTDDLERSLRRQLDRLLPSGMARDLAGRVGAVISAGADRFRDEVAQGLADELSAILLLPSSAQRTALRDVRSSIGVFVAKKIGGLFDTSSCFELWQPEVTLTIPAFGESYSTIAGFENPFLEVEGGVTTDTR